MASTSTPSCVGGPTGSSASAARPSSPACAATVVGSLREATSRSTSAHRAIIALAAASSPADPAFRITSAGHR